MLHFTAGLRFWHLLVHLHQYLLYTTLGPLHLERNANTYMIKILPCRKRVDSQLEQTRLLVYFMGSGRVNGLTQVSFEQNQCAKEAMSSNTSDAVPAVATDLQ